MGFSRRRSFTQISGVVEAGATKEVDIIDFADFHGVDYKIKLRTASADKIKIFDCRATKKDLDAIESVFSVIGHGFNISCQVSKVGSDIVLRLVNNESFSLTYKVLKTLL